MPQYYNPGLFPASYSYTSPYMTQNSYAAPMQQPSTFMYTVDGEQAARAWQMPAGVAPGTVIPLFDVDGEHIYFKSTDAYGRLNPLRKGRVVLEEIPQLPQGASGDTSTQDISQFVTKDDLNELKKELRNMMGQRNNQNGNNRGENK